jgi:hypothetical protein
MPSYFFVLKTELLVLFDMPGNPGAQKFVNVLCSSEFRDRFVN